MTTVTGGIDRRRNVTVTGDTIALSMKQLIQHVIAARPGAATQTVTSIISDHYESSSGSSRDAIISASARSNDAHQLEYTITFCCAIQVESRL